MYNYCMKTIISLDSFSGAISPSEATAIAAKAVADVLPHTEIRELPVADGRIGGLYAFKKAVGGDYKSNVVHDPFMMPEEVKILRTGDVAVIDADEWKTDNATFDSRYASSYGIGELIKSAAEDGAKHIIIIATDVDFFDAGAGLLAALGATFTDAEGFPVMPNAKTFTDLYSVDLSSITKFEDIEFSVIPSTTKSIFGIPKGIDAEPKALYDAIYSHTGRDYTECACTACLGGVGYAVQAMFGARFVSGCTALCSVADVSKMMKSFSFVITNLSTAYDDGLPSIADLAKANEVDMVAYLGGHTSRNGGDITAETVYAKAVEIACLLKTASD